MTGRISPVTESGLAHPPEVAPRARGRRDRRRALSRPIVRDLRRAERLPPDLRSDRPRQACNNRARPKRAQVRNPDHFLVQHLYRSSHDPPLEGTGFEPSIPLLGQGVGLCRREMLEGWPRIPSPRPSLSRGGTDGSNPSSSASESVSAGFRGPCRPKPRLWRRSGPGLGPEKGTSWLRPGSVWPCFSNRHCCSPS